MEQIASTFLGGSRQINPPTVTSREGGPRHMSESSGRPSAST